MSEAVNDLMRNFDAEFGLGHHGGHFPNRPDRGGHFHGSDEEESSCDSSYNQVHVNIVGSHYNAIMEIPLAVSCLCSHWDSGTNKNKKKL